MSVQAAPESFGEHLVQNGVEFLDRAVLNMQDGAGVTELKFASVDLGVSIEVLLKARLLREHWTLICADANKAKPQEFMAGGVVTVAPEQLLLRLENVAGLLVSRKRRQELDELIRLRNRAIHFTLAGQNAVGLRTALARGLDFVLWLLDSELRLGGTDGEAEIVAGAIERLTEQLGQISEVVSQRMASIQEVLESSLATVECPRCRQPTLLLLDGESARCAFCLWNPEAEEGAEEYVEGVLGESHYVVVKEGGEWPVYNCLNCGREALVNGIRVLGGQATRDVRDQHGPPPSSSWGCFACGINYSEAEIDFCSRCGTPTDSGYDELTICADCIEGLMVDD